MPAIAPCPTAPFWQGLSEGHPGFLHGFQRSCRVQAMWELQLDPAAIVASTGGPVPAAIAFLLRRSLQAFPGCDISATVLGLLRVSASWPGPEPQGLSCMLC